MASQIYSVILSVLLSMSAMSSGALKPIRLHVVFFLPAPSRFPPLFLFFSSIIAIFA